MAEVKVGLRVALGKGGVQEHWDVSAQAEGGREASGVLGR